MQEKKTIHIKTLNLSVTHIVRLNRVSLPAVRLPHPTRKKKKDQLRWKPARLKPFLRNFVRLQSLRQTLKERNEIKQADNMKVKVVVRFNDCMSVSRLFPHLCWHCCYNPLKVGQPVERVICHDCVHSFQVCAHVCVCWSRYCSGGRVWADSDIIHTSSCLVRERRVLVSLCVCQSVYPWAFYACVST